MGVSFTLAAVPFVDGFSELSPLVALLVNVPPPPPPLMPTELMDDVVIMAAAV